MMIIARPDGFKDTFECLKYFNYINNYVGKCIDFNFFVLNNELLLLLHQDQANPSEHNLKMIKSIELFSIDFSSVTVS